MAGIEIPGLGRKLRLLVEHGHFDSWNDLARTFGRARSTVYGWGHGTDERAAGTIPGNRFEVLIDVVLSCLPPETTREEAKMLVLAPVIEFETEFKSQAMVSMNRIIGDEAKTSSGKLYPKPKANAGLIESDQNPEPELEPGLSIQLGKWFRLEFNTTAKTGYVSALQNIGQNWGAVAAHFERKTGRVLLPGFKTNRTLAHIRERREPGLHRFIVMQTPEPPPTEFTRYLVDGIALDGVIIRRMAQFYSDQHQNRRQMFLLKLQIRA
ncbi:MAG: hypothetical protein GY761_07010 [Hyphomicrobiales bacterium]|nr:hypothetical protein [Hyphomicrobiales bacterium]